MSDRRGSHAGYRINKVVIALGKGISLGAGSADFQLIPMMGATAIRVGGSILPSGFG